MKANKLFISIGFLIIFLLVLTACNTTGAILAPMPDWASPYLDTETSTVTLQIVLLRISGGETVSLGAWKVVKVTFYDDTVLQKFTGIRLIKDGEELDLTQPSSGMLNGEYIFLIKSKTAEITLASRQSNQTVSIVLEEVR